MDKENKKEKNNNKTEIIEIEVEKSQIELLKDSYNVLRKEYSLPEFEEMNKDFSIEKINEEETEYLIREIRRYISEKINTYLKFTETLIHPTNTQIFVFKMIKSITKDENKKLQNIYKNLAEKEIDLIELDLEYNLEKEITFIKNTFCMWQKIKKDLLKLIIKIKKDWNYTDAINYKNNDYFG